MIGLFKLWVILFFSFKCLQFPAWPAVQYVATNLIISHLCSTFQNCRHPSFSISSIKTKSKPNIRLLPPCRGSVPCVSGLPDVWSHVMQSLFTSRTDVCIRYQPEPETREMFVCSHRRCVLVEKLIKTTVYFSFYRCVVTFQLLSKVKLTGSSILKIG